MTSFYYIYEKFLAKITDDMYLELTPKDTLQDMRQLLIDAIPGFEFPRKSLEYFFPPDAMDAPEQIKNFFDSGDILNTNNSLNNFWYDGGEIENENNILPTIIDAKDIEQVIQEVFSPENTSYFKSDLTDEEMNILALLMEESWINR